MLSISEPNLLDSFIGSFSLEEEKKALEITNLVEGNSKENLKRNAFEFYIKYWEAKKNFYKDNEYNLPIAEKTIRDLNDNISIVHFSDLFAVIKKPSTGIDELDGIQNTDVIWILENNKWLPLLDYHSKFQNSKILDLNGDGKKDVVLIGGCCDTQTLNVFLVQKSGKIKYTQEINLIGDSVISLKENCKSSITVQNYQNDKIRKKVIFDCDHNKFQEN